MLCCQLKAVGSSFQRQLSGHWETSLGFHLNLITQSGIWAWHSFALVHASCPFPTAAARDPWDGCPCCATALRTASSRRGAKAVESSWIPPRHTVPARTLWGWSEEAARHRWFPNSWRPQQTSPWAGWEVSSSPGLCTATHMCPNLTLRSVQTFQTVLSKNTKNARGRAIMLSSWKPASKSPVYLTVKLTCVISAEHLVSWAH